MTASTASLPRRLGLQLLAPLAIAALLPGQGPAMPQSAPGQAHGSERAGLFEYRRPETWRAQDSPDGCRVLQPADDSGAIVRFLHPEDWTGSSAAYHDALLEALRQGLPIREGGRAAPFGAFVRSEARIGERGGPSLRLALYVARSGDRCQGVYFAAPTDEAFARHLAAADRLVRGIVLPAPRERAAGCEFVLPPGWQRGDQPGVTVLFPAGLDPDACGVVVLPTRAASAPPEEFHEASWTTVVAAARPIGRRARSEVGAFRCSRSRVRATDGSVSWLVLYTAARDGPGETIETIVFACADRHYRDHAAVVDTLVAGITFAATPAAQPVPAAQMPTPVPPPDRDVPMVGLWFAATDTAAYGMDLDGEFRSRLRAQFEILALWQNGIAYRGMHDAQPVFGKGLMSVLEGPAVVDAGGLAALTTIEDDRYARWTEQAGVVRIPFPGIRALELTRAANGFTARKGTKWIRVEPVDGLRLQGTYAQPASNLTPEAWISFAADGTFEQGDLVHALGGPTNNPGFPARGKGTYELRKWSLILRFDGGFTQTIQCLGIGTKLPDAPALVLGGAELVRR